MDKVIKFRTREERVALNAKEIFNCFFDKDGKRLYMAFMKDEATGEIAFGFIENYVEDKTTNELYFTETIILGYDEDGDIIESIEDILDRFGI